MPHAAGLALETRGALFTEPMRKELDDNRMNGVVGTLLVSETDAVRVWHVRLPAARRCVFHRHVLSYFWTCHSYGSSRSFFEDGSVKDLRHAPGDTRHMMIGEGAYVLHAVANTGPTELLYTTVEYKQGGNPPLPLTPGCTLPLVPWT